VKSFGKNLTEEIMSRDSRMLAGILLVVLPTVMSVCLVLWPVISRSVDETALSPFWKWLGRAGATIATILVPAAFLLSATSPPAKQPNGLINLVHVGTPFCAAAVSKSRSGSHSRAARRMKR